MLKMIEMTFENTDIMRFPADSVNMVLKEISETITLVHYQPPFAGTSEGASQEIGQGYISVRKDWFQSLAAEILSAAQHQTAGPLAQPILADYHQVDQAMVAKWLAKDLTAEQVQKKIFNQLTLHFVQGMPADLSSLTLHDTDQPARTLWLPWRNHVNREWLDYNEFAVNFDSPDEFVTMFDGRDPHIQKHPQQTAEAFGLVLGEADEEDE